MKIQFLLTWYLVQVGYGLPISIDSSFLWGNQKTFVSEKNLENTEEVGTLYKYKHRGLELGELNFLHTTDTHGWLGSHTSEELYDGDWGDLVDFQVNLKHRIEREVGGDLVMVDTGDKHDGNGLSDATKPNGIESTLIFNKMDYDLLTLGNHELYTEENSVLEYYQTALDPKFANKYVSSNVEFILSDGITHVPFGSKYSYFETKNQKIRILALSFLFDFKRFNKRTKVTPIDEEISKKWFQEMTQLYTEDTIDVLVIFGHLPITDHENEEINKLHQYIRRIYPNVVIQYFGGHSHIRDFVQLDKKSTGLQSGRFCETVGFLSISDFTTENPVFHRRYIDFNKESFQYHTTTTTTTSNPNIMDTYTDDVVETSSGKELSEKITRIKESLNLNDVFGYVPEDYYMYNQPVSSKNNIYNLLTTNVLKTLDTLQGRESYKRFVMINTGSIRFDLFKGNFTRYTEYTVSPFGNSWNYITIPHWIAEQLETILNNGPYIMGKKDYVRDFTTFNKNARNIDSGENTGLGTEQCPFVEEPGNAKGYSTLDDYGCDGEDTIHNSMEVFPLPIVVQYKDSGVDDPEELVDFIYYDFIQQQVLDAINQLSKENYSEKDCQLYGGRSTKILLRDYFSQFSDDFSDDFSDESSM